MIALLYSSMRILISWPERASFRWSDFFSLGDRTRLRLLNLMREGELCVCSFVEVLGLPQPKISRHLAYLRGAGVVAARREGKWMHYRITMPPDAGAAKILRQTLAALGEDKSMRADRARLEKACCLLEERGAPGLVRRAG